MSRCCLLFFIIPLVSPDLYFTYALHSSATNSINLCPFGEVPFLEEQTGKTRICSPFVQCPSGYYCNDKNICCGEAGNCPYALEIAKDSHGRIAICSLAEWPKCPDGSHCYSSSTVSQHMCCVEQSYKCPGKAVPFPNARRPRKCSLSSFPDSCPSSSHCMASIPNGKGICCTSRHYQRARNHCPPGWILSRNTVTNCNPATQTSCGGVSSCLPSIYIPQQFICCIPVTINSNLFGPLPGLSLTCSNSQLIPETMPNGQPRPCSLINPICSPGYVCQPSAQSSQMICCTAATSATYSCPLPTQAPALTGTNNVFCTSPGTSSVCPAGATCQLAANQVGVYICCYGASVVTPQCPAGTSPQQGPLGYVVCDITSSVQQCQTGYSCTRAANDNTRAICCSGQGSTLPVCPAQQRPYLENGNPRYCSPNMPGSCPDGFACNAAINMSGTFICCSAASSNACPTNFVPSLGNTGNEISCSPNEPSACPAGAVCLESQIALGTGTYLCCRSSQALRVCPNNQNAFIMADGQVESCTGPGAPCSQAGYTCQFSSTLGSWVCCGQGQTMALCADGRETYYQVEGQTYSCVPSATPTGCPVNYDCAVSNVAGIYVCCGHFSVTTTVVPTVTTSLGCPIGWNPYRSELDGSNRYCQNAIDMNCPTGFSCTQSTQQGIYMCCRLATSLRCVSGQTTLLVNNQPRLCQNLRRNACPSGYSCRPSNMASVYICCANFRFFEQSDSSVGEDLRCLKDGSLPAMNDGKIKYCFTEMVVSCPFEYVCSPSTQKGVSVCCKSKNSLKWSPGLLQSELNIPFEQDGRLVDCSKNENVCPTGYTCHPLLFGSKMYCYQSVKCKSGIILRSPRRCISATDCGNGYICQDAENFEESGICCPDFISPSTRCLGRETLLSSGMPVGCQPLTVCPSGYTCSSHTTTSEFVCCKSYKEMKQVCPDNREAYRDIANDGLFYCDRTDFSCPDSYVCKQAVNDNRYVCCSPVASCLTGNIPLIDKKTNSPQRCFPDLENSDSHCADGYFCQVSAVPYLNVCCAPSNSKTQVLYKTFKHHEETRDMDNKEWYILEAKK